MRYGKPFSDAIRAPAPHPDWMLERDSPMPCRSYGSDFEPGNGVIGAPWRAADLLAESTYGLYGYNRCQFLAGADGSSRLYATGAHRIQGVLKPPASPLSTRNRACRSLHKAATRWRRGSLPPSMNGPLLPYSL